MLHYISLPHVFIMFLYHFGIIYGANLCASSCFLLSFCFRKFVRGSFSELAENLHELFLRRNKDGARRRPAGGPHRPQTAPRRGQTLDCDWGASGASPSYPFAYKSSSSRKPSIPDHIFQKTSEAPTIANPRSGGS